MQSAVLYPVSKAVIDSENIKFGKHCGKYNFRQANNNENSDPAALSFTSN